MLCPAPWLDFTAVFEPSPEGHSRIVCQLRRCFGGQPGLYASCNTNGDDFLKDFSGLGPAAQVAYGIVYVGWSTGWGFKFSKKLASNSTIWTDLQLFRVCAGSFSQNIRFPTYFNDSGVTVQLFWKLSETYLGPIWELSRPIWTYLGPTWTYLGLIWALSGPTCTYFGYARVRFLRFTSQTPLNSFFVTTIDDHG